MVKVQSWVWRKGEKRRSFQAVAAIVCLEHRIVANVLSIKKDSRLRMKSVDILRQKDKKKWLWKMAKQAII